MSDQTRHGTLREFLDLIDGLATPEIARRLRCCTRTVRNYLAGRSPIPLHRIEMLRLLELEALGDIGRPSAADETPIVATLDPDPAAPDVTPDEMLAWVGVHSPHHLSSKRSLAHYVRGWNVIDKIQRAKSEGTFAAVLARWRLLAVELPRMWRSGPMWTGIGPPAYRRN
ncbi:MULTISPECIES: IS21 family transposase [Burkholderia]|uniref:IS21 family transposase n=1 Tax=Burkholderia TaxID=32008 RepID=UPI001F062E59|nr:MULTISPECIES: IS21 family transposase [Burkholderia]